MKKNISAETGRAALLAFFKEKSPLVQNQETF